MTSLKRTNWNIKVHFVASHGHTVFHEPNQLAASNGNGMTFQIGDGASIAAELELPLISDLRNMDIAFGGQGAPIVPIAEKLLWRGYEYFLNLGGIANIAHHKGNETIAYDVSPANRVLNALLNSIGQEYDDRGMLAASGNCNTELLEQLNAFDYYKQVPPKSLSNEFGLNEILPVIESTGISLEDKVCTYVEHIAYQIGKGISEKGNLLVTGGGAHNDFLLQRIESFLGPKEVTIEKPDVQTIEFKEAICMALMGALRWREEENVLASVTGAKQNSIGGALWMGRN